MERKLKDSGILWIGLIPEHWEKIRCGLLFVGIGSGTTPTAGAEEFYSNGTVNWLQTGDLNDGIITETSKKITDFAVESKSLKVYPQGSVVIAMYGATIAKLGLLNINTTVNQACCVLEKSEKIISNYAFYFFYASKTWLISLASGGGQPNISQAIISNFKVIVPPLSEQEAIAAYLDKKCGEIDDLIEVEQQMISDLELYRQSVITEAVTRGLTPDVPKINTNSVWVPEIPSHWELHCLRGISDGFRKGSGITKDDLNANGDISCIRYGDLYTKYNHYINEIYCRTNVSKIQTPVYAAYGDIYFTCSGEDVNAIGKSVAYLSEEECLIGGDLIIMRHSQNPKFLGYSLDSIISQKQKSYGKSKLKVVHTSVKDLKNVAVPLPPLSEQQEIADYLDAKCAEIDELIKVKQEKIETLKQYRQSLIFEAVTGKTTIA